jgi:hypothetical protein
LKDYPVLSKDFMSSYGTEIKKQTSKDIGKKKKGF